MDKRLKILFLSPRLPYPLIGGDRVKPYNILKHLGQHHDVTLVSLYQGVSAPKEYTDELEKLGIKLHVVSLDPIKAGIRTAIMTLSSDFPLEIAYYNQPEFGFLVEKLQKQENFDVGIAFFMRTAEYIKTMPFKKILMSEDCRLVYQQRSSDETKSLKQKLVRRWEVKKLKKYEPRIVNYFDAVTLVTNEDIESMKLSNLNANYRLLTNGTDIQKFVPPQNNDNRKDILFLGKLDIQANVLMLKRIAQDIFPAIKQQVPEVKLKIVGAKPPAEVKKLVGNGIELYPDVPDAVPWLQSAQLFLHPHTGGSGIQNKLLEAMACGCPVVTSPTGNQGIHALNGRDAFIANNNKEFIDYSVKLLKDKDLADTISQNCRKLIEETHSWELVYRQMDDILSELTNQ